MDLRAQFGQILQEFRNSQQLTQEELAFRAGMDVTYLSDLERGLWNPSLAILVDLARGLGTHPAELLKDLQIDPSGSPSERKRTKRQ
jgi:transcriptional regulator with XRE-family HTH domain